ncbi:MAG: translation initiation factor IF-2 [Chloroflexi bacterium]|nr:translation initiation factor IF-2 [Chloroflexota bacterium]
MASKTRKTEAPVKAAPAVRPRATQKPETPPALQALDIPQAISVGDLSNLLRVSSIDVIKQLMRHGHMYSINEVIDHDVAAQIVEDFGFIAKVAEDKEGAARLGVSSEGEDPTELQSRSPVVTILGHVDHGKTTLLDAIRNTRVAAGEAGGITQHIGAYQVEYNGNKITFLDTPGHAAFTAMRARGAKVTDIAILVVAADDGIMPQTIEAIDHAKAAGVPIIVAVNKVDKANANPDKVKQQLVERELVIEEWGGDVIAVEVSALKGEGISDLLENILVVAEVAELKANPNRNAAGVVVESRVDKSRGPVATVLVQAGTLRIGDYVVAGSYKGRVKAMLNDLGKRIKEAGPSTPVEILGLDGVPDAGEFIEVADDEKAGRQMAEAKTQELQTQARGGGTLEDVYSRVETGEITSLNLILKTDVQGSVEAVRQALEKLNTEKTRVNFVHSSAGSITENDVTLASASNAVVIGFNVQSEPGARSLSRQLDVNIKQYGVIYTLVDDIESALKGMMEPTYKDVVDGEATVRAVFNVGRNTVVAGFYVNSGKIARDAEIHLLRDKEQIYVGKITSLKHFKNDVREVATGLEGGLTLEGFKDFEEGDILEPHRREKIEVK